MSGTLFHCHRWLALLGKAMAGHDAGVLGSAQLGRARFAGFRCVWSGEVISFDKGWAMSVLPRRRITVWATGQGAENLAGRLSPKMYTVLSSWG